MTAWTHGPTDYRSQPSSTEAANALKHRTSGGSYLFSGQNQLPGLVSNAAHYSVGALLLLLVCKGLAYGGSLAGFRGGPVFPSMYIGATFGGLGGKRYSWANRSFVPQENKRVERIGAVFVGTRNCNPSGRGTSLPRSRMNVVLPASLEPTNCSPSSRSSTLTSSCRSAGTRWAGSSRA